MALASPKTIQVKFNTLEQNVDLLDSSHEIGMRIRELIPDFDKYGCKAKIDIILDIETNGKVVFEKEEENDFVFGIAYSMKDYRILKKIKLTEPMSGILIIDLI